MSTLENKSFNLPSTHAEDLLQLERLTGILKSACSKCLTTTIMVGLLTLADYVLYRQAILKAELSTVSIPANLIAMMDSQNEKSLLMDLVVANNIGGLEIVMANNIVPNYMKAYILAQMLVVDATMNAKPIDAITRAQLSSYVKIIDQGVLESQAPGIPGDILYALETVASGTVKTAPAQAYVKTTAGSQQSTKYYLEIGVEILTGSIPLTSLLWFISHGLSARVRRIKVLLSHLSK